MARLSTLSRSLAGKVMLVTGAASGMGRATAHLLADEGARVGIVDRDSQGLARVAAEIMEAGGGGHAALAVELGPSGVTVNCVCPGPINTGMTAAIPDSDKAVYARRRTALRRYGEPEEVAQITMSLLLPAASYITGAVLPVDGGLTVRNA